MFFRSRRIAGAIGLGAAALLLSACGPSAADRSGSGDSGELVFAAVPSEESASLQQDYQPVIDMLAKETGKRVTFQKATDYAAVVEGQRAGKIDLAQYGPLSYVMAKNKGVPTTAIAAQVEDKGEQPTYLSYGITRPGSGISGLQDFKGKKVCFVDPSSTSGYLYPRAGLMQAGLNPDTDVTPVFAGGHDASALAVAKGDCDAGFAQSPTVDTLLIKKGQLQPGQLDTVWKSDTIAGSPLSVTDKLDPATRDKVVNAFKDKANGDYLRANGFCQGECKITDAQGWGYLPIDDSMFSGVRKVCEVTRDKQCQ